MEPKFFELWEIALEINPFLYLDFGYHKMCGYTFAMSAESATSERWQNAFFKIEHTNKDYVFAKAYIALADYLTEKNGGW
jgi:hypothetical protein